MCKEKYVLVQWPDSQELMEYEGFNEHSSYADYDTFGPAAYFVEEEWLKGEHKIRKDGDWKEEDNTDE